MGLYAIQVDFSDAICQNKNTEEINTELPKAFGDS